MKKTTKNLSASEIFALNLKGLMAMQGVSASEMQTYMKKYNREHRELALPAARFW